MFNIVSYGTTTHSKDWSHSWHAVYADHLHVIELPICFSIPSKSSASALPADDAAPLTVPAWYSSPFGMRTMSTEQSPCISHLSLEAGGFLV